MRTTKRIMAIFAAMVLGMVCFTACGKKEAPANDAPTTAEEPAETEEQMDAADIADIEFESATYTLNLPMAESDTDGFYVLSKLFADKVSEKTKGAVTIEIYTNSQLGAGADAVMGVEMGTIDFNVDSANTLSNEYSKISVCDLPYLFDDAQKAMNFCSSEYMQQMQDEIASDLGIRILAFGDGGFRAVWSTKGEIHSVDDFKGLKVRVPDVTIYVDTFSAVGANPTPMAGSEVFTALQQGAVDATEVPLSVGISQGFMEACKYVTMDKHFFNLLTIQCAESTWNGMSPELQAVVAEAAKEAQEEQVARMSEVEDSLIKEIEDAGLTYVKSEDIDFTGIREAVQTVYESYRDTIGADFYDSCMEWFDAN